MNGERKEIIAYTMKDANPETLKKKNMLPSFSSNELIASPKSANMLRAMAL
jgi:hypothetical protein